MFKVSFKETDKSSSMAITRVGRTTTVILRGITELPSFFKDIPKEIMDWIGQNTKVECYEDLVANTLIIYSTGMARCHKEDEFSSLLGERIAESRAKYYIYKFFFDLCYKWCEYYGNAIYGHSGPAVSTTNEGLMGCMKKYEALCIRESHHLGELLASKENG